jgi:hypothetical protein
MDAKWEWCYMGGALFRGVFGVRGRLCEHTESGEEGGEVR